MGAQLWFFLALSASMLWGLSYALMERALHAGLAPSFLLVVTSLVTFPLYLIISTSSGTLKSGLDILINKPSILAYVLIGAFTIIAGNYLILHSVSMKNATLSSMIEISYPFFTALFCWLLFKDVQLNAYTAMGAVLIFSGIAVIFFKN